MDSHVKDIPIGVLVEKDLKILFFKYGLKYFSKIMEEARDGFKKENNTIRLKTHFVVFY